MKKIILIETSDVGARATAEAVQWLGFEPVFLVKKSNYQGDTLAQLEDYECFEVDTTSVDALEAFIRARDWSIEAITTFLDSRLHLAIELAKRFGVRGLEASLLPYKDKGRVEELGAEICPPSISFQKSDVPLAEIEKLRERFGKVILKPRCTAGGLGTCILTREEPLQKCLDHIQSAAIPTHLQPDEWMAQAFVEGELVSVEGFVESGEIKILGLTGRRKVGNTESWAGFPYESRLSVSAREQSIAKVRNLMELSGIKQAFFHIELMVNETDAFVIDANLGRMGGGGVGEIFASAYGTSTTRIFAEVLRISLGLDVEKADFWNHKPRFAISIAYGVKTPCELQKLEVPKLHSVYHTQILSYGHVPAMGHDNWAWVGITSGLPDAVNAFLRDTVIHGNTGPQLADYAADVG